jgi:hypothetical protein
MPIPDEKRSNSGTDVNDATQNSKFSLTLRDTEAITEGEFRSTMQEVAKQIAKLEEGQVITEELLKKVISV